MLFKRNLSIVVIATLLLTFISTGIATPALGKSSRVAVITDLTGSATVKSSGGSREYDAYIDMGLAQGDYITTDSNSSVKFKIKDHEDEVTIGANSVIALTTLTDKGKGKKSKIKVLSGSVWSNVKKLSGGDDFEVETPTAVMAVRGTKVLTSVDSESGETYVAVAAGTVSAKTNNDESTAPEKKDEILIAPSQQLSLDSRDEVSDLETKVGIIDTKDLVGGTSSEIIEAIVKDKADIDRENAEFIAAQKDKIAKGDTTGISRGGADSSLNPKDQSELDKVAKNLDNLIGNVVNTALEEKKVDKSKIDKIIEDINKDITDPNKKLDLSKVEPLDKTAGVDPALQKAKDEELKKLADAKKAADDAKKAAEDAAKLKLADALKKLEDEKARIAREKEALGLNKPTPTPNPTATPTPSATPRPSGSPQTPVPGKVAAPTIEPSSSGTFTEPKLITITTTTSDATIYYTIDGTTPTTSSGYGTPGTSIAAVEIGRVNNLPSSGTFVIKAIAVKSGSTNSDEVSKSYTIAIPTFRTPVITAQSGNNFTLSLGIDNLSNTNQIHGIQIQVVYDKSPGNLNIEPQANLNGLTSDFFNIGTGSNSSVTRFDNKAGLTQSEILFAAVLPNTSLTNSTINGLHKLAELPLTITNAAAGTSTLRVYITISNNDGSKTIVNNLQTITLTHGAVGVVPGPV